VHTIRSHVDQIVREGAERPRVLGVGVHPFLVGQPARFNSFRDLMAELVSCDDVWVTTPDEIAQLYIDQG
jgi:hypothetical protein